MLRFNGFLVSAVLVSVAGPAQAAQYGIHGISDPAVPAGFVANELFWDGGGTLDWTSTGLRIDLSVGSFYQDLQGTDRPLPPAIFDIVPSLEFDTYFGIPGDGTGGIPGGAGDLGGGPFSTNAPQLSVSWFNTDQQNTDFHRTGMVTISDDAVGTGSIWVNGQVHEFSVIDGAIPDFSYAVSGTSGGIQTLVPGPWPVLPSQPPANNAVGITTRTVSSPDVPAGHVAHQIIWNGNGTDDWRAAALRVDLTSGTVFQHALGSDLAPDPAFVGAYPDLAFDTHLGIIGDETNSISGGALTGINGAEVLGGNGVFSLTEPYLSASWYNDDDKVDTGLVQIGMLTLSDDANGKIALHAHGQAWGTNVVNGEVWIAEVVNGQIVPEPVSLALFALVGPTLLRRQLK